MNRASSYREIAGLLAGFTLWAAAFVALYAGHGYACSPTVGAPVPASARAILIGTLAAFLAAHAVLAAWFWKRLRDAAGTRARRQLRLWAFALALAALPATAWTGLPVVTLSLCT
jgi:Na+/proline symporter